MPALMALREKSLANMVLVEIGLDIQMVVICVLCCVFGFVRHDHGRPRFFRMGLLAVVLRCDSFVLAHGGRNGRRLSLS